MRSECVKSQRNSGPTIICINSHLRLRLGKGFLKKISYFHGIFHGGVPPCPLPWKIIFFSSNNFEKICFIVYLPWNTLCMIPVIPSSNFGWVRAFSLAAILKSTKPHFFIFLISGISTHPDPSPRLEASRWLPLKMLKLSQNLSWELLVSYTMCFRAIRPQNRFLLNPSLSFAVKENAWLL